MNTEKNTYKTILSKAVKSHYWFDYDYNMNLYRGCSHGCIYCDSRSACYGIIDFEKIIVKDDALEILEAELSRKRKSSIIGVGSMSDPYNPREETEMITRGALKLIEKYGHGIIIMTKSTLMSRDIDLFKKINKTQPVICMISISTMDDELAKQIEPNVSKPSERLKAIEELSESGIVTGVLLMPTLPFLTDSSENIIDAVNSAKEAGARFIYPSFGVTLRGNQRNYYYEKLNEKFPGVKDKYNEKFGEKYYCGSINTDELRKVLIKRAEELEIDYEISKINKKHLRSQRDTQLSFF